MRNNRSVDTAEEVNRNFSPDRPLYFKQHLPVVVFHHQDIFQLRQPLQKQLLVKKLTAIKLLMPLLKQKNKLIMVLPLTITCLILVVAVVVIRQHQHLRQHLHLQVAVVVPTLIQ